MRRLAEPRSQWLGLRRHALTERKAAGREVLASDEMSANREKTDKLMFAVANGTIFVMLLKLYFHNHYQIHLVVLVGLMTVVVLNAAIYVGILLRKRREQARR